MTLGEKILRLRKEHTLSQEDLAAQLTVSRQAVSRWELGESVPDTEHIVQLSKRFGVSTDYLLNDAYESDRDIPVVKISSAELKADYRNKFRIASYCMLGLGLIGILTLLILTSVVPAWGTVQVWGYPPIAIDAYGEILPDEYQIAPPGEQVRMWTSAQTRGNLGAFLDTFNLGWLFVLYLDPGGARDIVADIWCVRGEGQGGVGADLVSALYTRQTGQTQGLPLRVLCLMLEYKKGYAPSVSFCYLPFRKSASFEGEVYEGYDDDVHDNAGERADEVACDPDFHGVLSELENQGV